ncbi:hypothetical protein [Candidatus Venteria ishoeyi]|nr:hypothetical protein [Candidatus Venteria ishoeyi]
MEFDTLRPAVMIPDCMIEGECAITPPPKPPQLPDKSIAVTD